MRFKVPIEKDTAFSSGFFQLLEEQLVDLKLEAGKWPDRITFSGPLGVELHRFMQDRKWAFDQFNPVSITSPVNKITFEYSKPLDQIEERGGTILDQSLNNREIQGIPGKETISKILASYATPAFKIEKTVRPKREILLVR